MIRNKILVKIDMSPNTSLSGENVVISATNFPFSGISKTQVDRLEKNNGADLMVMGDDLNKGTTISENDFWIDDNYRYNGFTGGLSNDNGIIKARNAVTSLLEDITIRFKSNNNTIIDSVTIFFDSEAMQWATEAYLDGYILGKVYNDDNEWSILFPEAANEHTVTFTKWNRPNYNARITFLAFELDNKVFDKRWYNQISLTQQIMPLQPEPFFDVMSSVGTIGFNDINGELRDYATDGILQPNLPCEIFINDYKISTSIVNEWGDYDVQAKQVQANLVDRLAKLDNKFTGMVIQQDKKAWDVLKLIEQVSGLNINADKIIITGTNLDLTEKSIATHLQNINIKYAFLEKSTMREALIKICQIAMIVIYYTAAGNVYLDTARPRLSLKEKNEIVVIQPTTQEPDFQETIIPKNNYSGIEWTENIVSLESLKTSDTLWRSITYSEDKGLFVAVGTNAVAYSTDGQRFTLGTIQNHEWRAITYAEDKGLFMVVGGNSYYDEATQWIQYEGFYAQSSDGITFAGDKFSNVAWLSLFYSQEKNLYVMVGQRAINISLYAIELYYSTTINGGYNRSTAPSGSWRSVTYSANKNLFVAVGTNVTAYSTDGITYVSGSIPTGNWSNIIYAADKGLFVAVGSGVTAYSADGRNFTLGSIPTGGWGSIAYAADKGLFVAVSTGGVAYSTDGINFISGIIPTGVYDVVYSQDRAIFTGVGASGIVVYSVDGIVFTDMVTTVLRTTLPSYPLNSTNRFSPFTENELFQRDTTIDGQTIGQYNAVRVYDDYSEKQGIRTATVTLYGSVNHKYENGNIAVEWNGLDENGNPTGEPTILKLGQIVKYINKDGTPISAYKNGEARLYKITGIQSSIAGNSRFVIQNREVW